MAGSDAMQEPELRIVGGAAVPNPVQMYPWSACLFINKTSGYYRCGGTLVSPTVVLTAAHCVAGSAGDITYGITVLLGWLRVDHWDPSTPISRSVEPNAEAISATSWRAHKLYDSKVPLHYHSIDWLDENTLVTRE